MIRRAQAEALLKLAEALEECERNAVTIEAEGIELFWGERGVWLDMNAICNTSVRFALAKLYTKSEEAE